jgi:hypothetical protein
MLGTRSEIGNQMIFNMSKDGIRFDVLRISLSKGPDQTNFKPFAFPCKDAIGSDPEAGLRLTP